MPKGRKSKATWTKTRGSPKRKDIPVVEKLNFEVEAIVGWKSKRGKSYYLIKWMNYAESENSWEPEENLNCPNLLTEYKKKMASNVDAALATNNPRGEFIDIQSDQQTAIQINPTTDVSANSLPSVNGVRSHDLPDLNTPKEERLKNPRFESSDESDEDSSDDEGDIYADDNPMPSINGFDRGWQAKKVYGITQYPNGSIWVLVGWKGDDQVAELVPIEMANEKIPQLMLAYYQDRLVFQLASKK